jgi:small subunit ribosomal protein S6
MATEKNTYELTLIVSGVLSEDQIKESIGRVRGFIESHGGEILEMDEWGTRRLAYPINKKRSGYYVNAFISAPGEIVTRLERQLTIDETILRYLTLRLDAKMLRHYETQKSEAGARRAAELDLAALATDDDDED